MRKAERGQALFETAVFLPLMLVALLAIMYFSQYGVLQGRAVQAVRYASLVTNGAAASQNSSLFSIEAMYAELWREGQNPGSNPGEPNSNYACDSSGTNADTAAVQAINQAEALPNAVATATAPPFFQANGGAPTGTCSVKDVRVPGATNVSTVSATFFRVQFTQVTAQEKVPNVLAAIIGGGGASLVDAAMSYPLPASPSSAIYCSSSFAQIMDQAVTPQQPMKPNALAPPYGGYTAPVTPNCS